MVFKSCIAAARLTIRRAAIMRAQLSDDVDRVRALVLALGQTCHTQGQGGVLACSSRQQIKLVSTITHTNTKSVLGRGAGV